MLFGTDLLYLIPESNQRQVQAITRKNTFDVGDNVNIGPKIYQIISFKKMIVPEFDEAQRVAILKEVVARAGSANQ